MKMICGCELTKGEGLIINPACEFHTSPTDAERGLGSAKRFGCDNYRPNRQPLDAYDWPRCACDEIAQEH